VVATSRHDTCIVIYLAVKGEYPQTSVVVNTVIRPGSDGPSGVGETFTTSDA